MKSSWRASSQANRFNPWPVMCRRPPTHNHTPGAASPTHHSPTTPHVPYQTTFLTTSHVPYSAVPGMGTDSAMGFHDGHEPYVTHHPFSAQVTLSLPTTTCCECISRQPPVPRHPQRLVWACTAPWASTVRTNPRTHGPPLIILRPSPNTLPAVTSKFPSLTWLRFSPHAVPGMGMYSAMGFNYGGAQAATTAADSDSSDDDEDEEEGEGGEGGDPQEVGSWVLCV